MQRRGFLKAAAATLACPVCAGLGIGSAGAAEKTGGGHAAHWSYEGHGGPEHWGSLEDGFKACSMGREQSPIDLHEPIPAMVGGLKITWKTIPLAVGNNGHTIQVETPGGGTLEVNGKTYELLQFHFHHPSEHTVNGGAHAMEVHFVHKSAAGDLAVVGVFLRPGAENPALVPIWAAMPGKAGDKVSKPEVNITPAGLLPARDVTYRYAGSLTTPPCSEIVSWIVYQDPVEMSAAQIAAFAALFPMNARPVQGLNRRNLLIGAF